jgi:chromosome segregation ATPase
LDESLSFCSEYRQIIQERDRKLAAKDEEIRQLEAMLLERDQQLKRFSEAYTKLKGGLEFYIPQIEEWKRQKYSLGKQYETALEEHTKKLMEEFTRLKQGYEESARRGDREGSRESEGEREERGGHLRELRARVAEGLRGVLPAAAPKP